MKFKWNTSRPARTTRSIPWVRSTDSFRLRPKSGLVQDNGRAIDITLVGRTVTVIRDGVLIIDRAEIPGITGGALDSRESEPGPIYLQGDHTGGLRYRNITISVPTR